jgi:hypothetical protein
MTYFARAAACYNAIRAIILAVRGAPTPVETGELLILPGSEHGVRSAGPVLPALQEPMPPRASSGGGLEADLTKVALDSIRVRVKPSERIEDAERQITALLRERHRLRSGQADDFHIREIMKWR